ncbi:MAG: phosphoenolpyruvate carboxykinase domain-containing protein [Corynebacterium variabile]|uniref:phosphoenolpyruvate carboxykinase domain-containing protein n=1 Tax=Corynebacterium variabile TaxID=1727 RepID=UPI003F931F28
MPRRTVHAARYRGHRHREDPARRRRFPSASGKTNLAIEAIRPGTGTIFTNVAYNELTEEVWREGRTPTPPTDTTGWRDWTGELITERPADRKDAPWAHPNSRFTTTLANVTTLAPDAGDAAGVPVDLVITRDREPLTPRGRR